eukprot:COSAG02_NODE_2661_length_8306_cov_942.235287_2_plen_129_part_00
MLGVYCCIHGLCRWRLLRAAGSYCRRCCHFVFDRLLPVALASLALALVTRIGLCVLLPRRDTADDELFPTLGRRVAEDERQVLEQLSTKQLCGLISPNPRSKQPVSFCSHVAAVTAHLLLPHSVCAFG